MTKSDLYCNKTLLGLPNRYPGLTYTARQISLFFPKCKIYVEPFAGLARTAKYVNCEIIVLNDKSEHSNKYCKKKFRKAIVENMDFIETIKKYDSKDTFFLIDPVWRSDFYDGTIKFNDKWNFKNRKNTEILTQRELKKSHLINFLSVIEQLNNI